MKKHKNSQFLFLFVLVFGISISTNMAKGETLEYKTSLSNCQYLTESFNTNVTEQGNKTIRITNIKPITSENHFSSPVWSPDGAKVLVTAEGNTGLYVVFLNDNKIKKINNVRGAGYNAAWSEDSKNVFYREKMINSNNSSYYEVRSINIESNETLKLLKIDPNGIASNTTAKTDRDPIVFTNTQTLLIEATYLDKSKTWIVTHDPGQYYQPILSPDKTKVVVHRGSEMLVYAIDGSGLISNLGKGLACSWSFDSRQILYFIDESQDGHQITGSDIYLVNADATAKWQLTYTKDVYEMFPNWSPDNKRIVFSDDKSGKIFIADIVKQ